MNAQAQIERDPRDHDAIESIARREAPRLVPVEPITEAMLDALAEELIHARRNKLLALAIEWGQRILTTIYGDDIERMRARGDDKDISLRGLAQRMDVSPSQLHHAVQIYDFVRRYPALVRDEHLTVTHFRCVMPLPDARRVELLQKAIDEQWTTKALERRARSAKKVLTGGRGGRPRLPEGIKTLNSMHKYAENPEHHLIGLDDFERLSPKQARRLRQTLDVMLERLGHARAQLGEYLGEADGGRDGQPAIDEARPAD